MIQVYSPSNTNYTNNGDCVLLSSFCEISAELNGSWVLSLSHPIDDEGRWKYIEENAVLKVPTWYSGNSRLQRYRIRTVEKTDNEITATAYPVFFDSANDAFIIDIRLVGKTVSQGLQLLFAAAPSKYSYNVYGATTGRATEEFQNVNLMEALETFKTAWDVEFLYDNNMLAAYQQAGTDNGVTVEYGKNITGINYTVDMSDVATRIIPYAYNGRMMSGSSPWVDSGLVNTYPKVFVAAVQFDYIKLAADATDDDLTDESITVCQTQAALNTALTAEVLKLYTAGRDKPKISMSIDMLALEDTEEYKGFSGLEEIRLGDTVHCRHSKLDITSDARVVGITWDCARDRISGVVLGDFDYDFLKDEVDLSGIQRGLEQITKNLNPDGTIMAERVRGILNGMSTQLQAQYTAAERQHVLAILFEDTDQTSPLYGALGIGTQGLQIANSKDQQGNWVWRTAITANGILTGALIADLVSDATGHNFWNLLTGELAIGHTTNPDRNTVHVNGSTGAVEIQAFDGNNVERFYLNSATGVVRINATSFTLTGDTIADIADDKAQTRANDALTSAKSYADTGDSNTLTSAKSYASGLITDYSPADHLSQQQVFNRLTNNGTVQGLFLQNGNLYCNAAFMSITDLSAFNATIGGWTIANNKLSAGNIELVADSKVLYFSASNTLNGRFVRASLANNGDLVAKDICCDHIEVYRTAQHICFDVNTYGVHLYDIQSASSLYTDSTGFIKGTSSSKRFKDIKSDFTDIEAWYTLTAKVAKYKDGYLPETDEWNGKYMPMLIAEDVDAICHEAALHDSEGNTSDWNHRILIPVHQQMLVEQHEKIQKLEAKVQTLEDRITQLEALVLGKEHT